MKVKLNDAVLYKGMFGDRVGRVVAITDNPRPAVLVVSGEGSFCESEWLADEFDKLFHVGRYEPYESGLLWWKKIKFNFIGRS